MEFVLLKELKSKSLEKVYHIYLSAFSDSNFQILNKQDFEDFYRMGTKIYVLMQNDIYIAYVVVMINGEILEIISIGVNKSFQKHGYGKYLLDNLIKINKNSCKIYLEVSRTNNNAISFYKSYGFSLTGVRKQYYIIRKGVNKGEKVDALLYEYIVK